MGTVLLAGWTIGTAHANPVSPSLKPAPQLQSSLVAPAELAALDRALSAADNGRWSDVRAAIAKTRDAGAKALLNWRMASDGNSGMSFSDLAVAVEAYSDWPGYSRILEQAETTITRSGLTANERIEWLRKHGPSTDKGVLALARAYDEMGHRPEAVALARQAWRSRRLSSDAEDEILSEYGASLDSEDYRARVDYLLWRGDVTEARSLLSHLSSGARAAATARIALRRNERNVDALVQAVPADYASDPGLSYERARWRERRGLEQGELEMLLEIRGSEAIEAGRDAIWREKQQVIRRLIRERDFQTAYTLATDHGMTDGDGFRDAEWMAGWLALRFLDKPAEAEAHFRTFLAGVTTPISVARGQFWLGEALTAQNRGFEAFGAYDAAAKFNYVYYGQLAAERIASVKPEAKILSLPPLPEITADERASFEARPIIRAAILLGETGRDNDFEAFSYAIDDTLETAAEHQMLYDVGARFLKQRAAVRGAKAGLARGLIAPDAVYPLISLPKSSRNGAAEPAMVLALTRQESEFDPQAISSANARGLMQMVPRYARAEARMVGVPFRESWLTDDPEYNLKLGRGFLDDLVSDYHGSYALAAAAYNAGPSRAKRWIEDYGDPRGAVGVDPIDWVEMVPFEETRNYIMRVLENTQVYRHRLAGQPTEVRLLEDLKRGRP
ncbi:MAG: lytic transglycosylase domain-containing protein [Hyphomonadaceae bacterium]